MNVFLHELRARRKSVFLWALSLCVLMVVSMAKFEAITAQGGAAVSDMMKSFPATIQAVFGMSGLDLTTIAGYFGVCFLILAVALAIHAGLTGVSVVGGDELDHTTEFLYVKPRSRARIITAKLLAGLVLLAVAWGAGMVGSIIGIEKFARFGDFMPDFWRMMTAAALIQVVFFTFGAATAAVVRRTSIQGRVISVAIFGSYLIYVLAKSASSLDWVHYGGIFSWFDALGILQSHELKLHYSIAALLLSIVFLVVTYLSYRRRDLLS